MGTSERQQAWTRYWQSGALHSCVGSYDGNYGGAVAAFWRAQFAGLDADRRLLDLGTGNGPLPALALSTLGVERLPRIDAVDLARPRPPWLSAAPADAQSRITFHAGVRMESLPFPDAAFDRVVSQYGFEYADTALAAAEVLRVLAPGGAVALVCHHAQSRLVEVAQEEVAHIEWLLSEDSVVAAVAAFAPFLSLPKSDEGQRASDRFNAAMARMVERAQGSPVPDALHDAADMVRAVLDTAGRRGADAAAAMLDRWVEAARDARVRSAELCANALDDGAARALCDIFKDGGLTAAADTLYEGDYLIGWTITAR
jgi:SAM-dependent methyltransferase